MNPATTNRRAFLRGAGATLCLPWLEAFGSPTDPAHDGGPRRMAIVVMPNGVLPDAWQPRGDGDGGWIPSFSLQPLAARRHEVSVLTGLANRHSFDGDGHYAKVAPLLTGRKIRRTGGRDLWNGVSMDQVAANTVGRQTLLPSLELACDPIYPVEDMGYSTIYGGHIAWSAPDRPMTRELSPRAVFDRLCRRTALANDAAGRSVLDLVADDARRLQKSLGRRDRDKLHEFSDSVRALERRIEAAERVAARTAVRRAVAIDAAAPPAPGAPPDYPTHVGLMFDLIALAFATDATRVVTFLMANEVSGRNFAFVDGCAGGFHEYSHHEGKADKQEAYRRINRWHVQQFAGLLDRLAALPENHGSVLDASMVVLASAMRDGNAHSPHDLPVLLAGRGGGSIPPGRLLESKRDTPLCCLWLSMLQRLGVDTQSFGDADSPLL